MIYLENSKKWIQKSNPKRLEQVNLIRKCLILKVEATHQHNQWTSVSNSIRIWEIRCTTASGKTMKPWQNNRWTSSTRK